MPIDTPSVAAVPASDHQHMAAFQPRGKKISPSANRLGRNTSSVIQTRSVSMGSLTCPQGFRNPLGVAGIKPRVESSEPGGNNEPGAVVNRGGITPPLP